MKLTGFMTELHNTRPAGDRVLSINEALQLLSDSVRAASQQTETNGKDEAPSLKTFSVNVDLPDPLTWLSSQELYPKLYWMNREKNDWSAGIGEADRIALNGTGPNERSFQMLDTAMRQKNPQARYIGGFCFDNRQPQNGLWEGFDSFVFILPLIQIADNGSGSSITCNLWLKPGEKPAQSYGRLIEALSSVKATPASAPGEIPELKRISYSPDRTQWIEKCHQLLNTFETGGIEKVMLARQTELEFSEAVHPLLFLIKYPFPENSTYRFYFEPVKGHAFFSFTPERLYRRDGDQLLTEALAGTVSKEALNGDDHEASVKLLNSEKDIREHKFVMDTIKAELEPVCSDIDMSKKVEVLQLHRLAHLYTSCRAKLKPEFRNDSAVLRSMHPTPAVGGVPREDSMDLIYSIEPFCRGWYAAPVGWLSRDASEFAVGIRSALVNGNRVYLYSGAGLVEGSNPFSEWEEVDQKIGDILAITQQAI
jgi:menaquinone-specific isochorismate synthase